MKLMISVFMIGLLIGVFAFYCISFLTNQPSRREKALNYLVDSYNSTIGLCFESPGSNVYWLSHDNILASYALQQLNATVANNITETVRRIGREYNLAVAETGLPVDCKLRALLGYNVNFFFNDTERVIINGSYYSSILKTETDQANPLIFTNYTDTLCYASFVEWRRQNFSGANYYFEQARAKWDGIGFNDSAYDPTKGYDTLQTCFSIGRVKPWTGISILRRI